MPGSIADVTDVAPPSDRPVILRSGDATVTLFPSLGGRIGQIDVDGQPLLVDVPDLDSGDAHPMQWGSFAMAPWAGRIRRGRFAFDGRDHRLPINHRDGPGSDRAHAIHGLVFDRPVDSGSVDGSDAARSWSGTTALEWEFGGSVSQTVTVFDDRVVSSLRIDATAGRFPAEIGWHPWFRKPDRLEFEPSSMYERDEFGLPTGRLVAPSDGPWDDCFITTEPIVLRYDRPTASAVTVTSDCDHVVVYDQPDDTTCVEPQSGPPDAFNLHPHIVAPELTRTMTISW